MSNPNYYLYCKNVAGVRVVRTGEELVEQEITRDSYTSIFKYDSSIKDYIDRQGGISGYNGATYGDYFILDLDGDKKQLNLLLRGMVRLLDKLRSYEHLLFYSGQKGWHIYIPKYLVKYDPALESNWIEANKMFANLIMSEFPELLSAGGVDSDGKPVSAVDKSVYKITQLFRFPYSQHPAEGAYTKCPRRYVGYNPADPNKTFEVDDTNRKDMLKDIFHNEDMPTLGSVDPIFDLTKPIKNIEQIEEVSYNASSPVGDDYMGFRYGGKHCITKMCNKKDLTGQRNHVAMVLTAHWFEEHMGRSQVEAIMGAWNNSLTEKLGAAELQRHITGWLKKGYKFGCNHATKVRFCSKTCPYYTTKDDDEDYVFDYESLTRKLVKHKTDEHLITMDLGKVYSGMAMEFVPDYGHVVLVVGGSSSGFITN